MRVMREVRDGMQPFAQWLHEAGRGGRARSMRRESSSSPKTVVSRARLLAATRALLATLASSAPEQELLQASIEALLELVRVRYGAIGMHAEDGRLQHFVYAGLSEDEAGRILHPPAGHGLLGTVIRGQAVIRLDNLSADRRSAGFPENHPHMTSLLAVPVSGLDRVYGMIYLCDKFDGECFDDEDEALALNFANALSLALDKEQKLAELRQEQSSLAHSAFHDPLTNLPNRVLLGDRIGQVLSKAHRNNTQAAILFCDLDDFKAINDSLGHHAGDHVLKTVSERLVSCLREEDTVARIGGDEFVFVLSGVESAEHVGIVAQKILDVMSQSVQIEECEIMLSASVGIALFPCDGVATEHLIRNADAAMYKAKANGKNSFRFFSEVQLSEGGEQDGSCAHTRHIDLKT